MKSTSKAAFRTRKDIVESVDSVEKENFTETVWFSKSVFCLKRCHWIVKHVTVRDASTIWKEDVLFSVFEADILSNTRPFVDGLRNSFWSINLFRPLKAINHETVLPFSLLPKFFDCEFKIAEDWWTRSPPRKILSNFAKTKGLAKIFCKKNSRVIYAST